MKPVVTCTLVRAAGTYLMVACETQRPIKLSDWEKLRKASNRRSGLNLLPSTGDYSAIQHFVGTFTGDITEGAIMTAVTAFLADNGFSTVVANEISKKMQRILDSF